ncbi:MAG: hypothetical protein ACKO8M_01055 [Microcystis panniformis]|jgi:hypothetical protein
MSNWRDPSEDDLGPQEFHREPKSKNKTNEQSSSTEKSQSLKNFLSSDFWHYVIFVMVLYLIIQFLYLTKETDDIQKQNELLRKQNEVFQEQIQQQNRVFQEQIEKIKLDLYNLKKMKKF